MLLAILTIILIGLVLVFLEVFLIPGTTLFGIAGGVALVVGVSLVYVYYDMKWGNIAAGVTALAVIIAVIGGFKVIQSNKLAMKAEITGRVNELEKNLFNVGDKGIAFTEIRPNGKGLFNDNKVDIYSNGEYIERGTAVEIARIDKDKIFVKTI
jgi:membrane-bound ClpP family serine protease